MEYLKSPVLGVVGALTSAYVALKVVDFIWVQFLKPSGISKYQAVRSPEGKAPWAFITGSSDGVGKDVAIELAIKGFNVILHGRSKTKLANLATQIQELNPKIETRTLSLDAGDHLISLDEHVKPVLEGIKITILVNCVGGVAQVVPVIYKPVGEREPEGVDSIISLNIRFMTHITRIVLPQMTEPGLIINVGSLSSHALPWLTIYGASKSYINTFSIALGLELLGDGRNIEVVGMKLGDVVGTPGNPDGGRAGSPDSKAAAKAIIARIGCGQRVITAYWHHALSELFLILAPAWMIPGVVIPVVQELRQKESERLKKAK